MLARWRLKRLFLFCVESDLIYPLRKKRFLDGAPGHQKVWRFCFVFRCLILSNQTMWRVLINQLSRDMVDVYPLPICKKYRFNLIYKINLIVMYVIPQNLPSLCPFYIPHLHAFKSYHAWPLYLVIESQAWPHCGWYLNIGVSFYFICQLTLIPLIDGTWLLLLLM